MSSSEAAMNKQKEDQEQELDIGEWKLLIKPRCLTFDPKVLSQACCVYVRWFYVTMLLAR